MGWRVSSRRVRLEGECEEGLEPGGLDVELDDGNGRMSLNKWDLVGDRCPCHGEADVSDVDVPA